MLKDFSSMKKNEVKEKYLIKIFHFMKLFIASTSRESEFPPFSLIFDQ